MGTFNSLFLLFTFFFISGLEVTPTVGSPSVKNTIVGLTFSDKCSDFRTFSTSERACNKASLMFVLPVASNSKTCNSASRLLSEVAE